MFLHVENSQSEQRRVQAATLRGWTTRHISAIFHILLCQSIICRQLNNNRHESVIRSSLLLMLYLFYPQLSSYFEAAGGGRKSLILRRFITLNRWF